MCQFVLSLINVIDSYCLYIVAVNAPSIRSEPEPSTISAFVPELVFFTISVKVLPDAGDKSIVTEFDVVSAKTITVPDVSVTL